MGLALMLGGLVALLGFTYFLHRQQVKHPDDWAGTGMWRMWGPLVAVGAYFALCWAVTT